MEHDHLSVDLVVPYFWTNPNCNAYEQICRILKILKLWHVQSLFVNLCRPESTSQRPVDLRPDNLQFPRQPVVQCPWLMWSHFCDEEPVNKSRDSPESHRTNRLELAWNQGDSRKVWLGRFYWRHIYLIAGSGPKASNRSLVTWLICGWLARNPLAKCTGDMIYQLNPVDYCNQFIKTT
jgi:hypothetical protein